MIVVKKLQLIPRIVRVLSKFSCLMLIYFLQAFSILSEAKEEDARKRQDLLSYYAKADALLRKMDEPMLALLQRHTKNVKDNMQWHEKQLKQTQYFLLVAGK